MREGLDLPEFGHLPFDDFVLENWDTASLLSRTEQKRLLVKKWIALGKYGRNAYALTTFNDPLPENIPLNIPQNLLSADDRAIASMLTTTLWTRTWFGSTTAADTDPASQQAQDADTAYRRLRKTVLQQGRENYHVPCISPEFVFEDRGELSPETHEGSPDITHGVATGRPGSVPGYLVAAMMHCPELFEGLSDDDWRHFDAEERAEELEESDRSQAALVLVADRKACEEGWVLGLAVNHRGQILPFRVRRRAKEAAQLAFDWQEGQPLSELANDEEEDIEYYLGQGDGWN